MTNPYLDRRLVVVVPFYNEREWISSCLYSLLQQKDPHFHLVLVDNASTDGSAEVCEELLSAHATIPWQIIPETQKGTGAASDTGFRFAIEQGADFVARTDADCRPDPNWTAVIRREMARGESDFLIGPIAPRTDEPNTSLIHRTAFRAVYALVCAYGQLAYPRPRSDNPFHYRYLTAAGNNLAIAASLYVAVGGFPRTAIESKNEDHELAERVRRHTSRANWVKDMLVYNSVRRLRRYGLTQTLAWYRFKKAPGGEVDVR